MITRMITSEIVYLPSFCGPAFCNPTLFNIHDGHRRSHMKGRGVLI